MTIYFMIWPTVPTHPYTDILDPTKTMNLVVHLRINLSIFTLSMYKEKNNSVHCMSRK